MKNYFAQHILFKEYHERPNKDNDVQNITKEVKNNKALGKVHEIYRKLRKMDKIN